MRAFAETFFVFLQSPVGRVVRLVVSLAVILWLGSQLDYALLATVTKRVSWGALWVGVVLAIVAYPLCALRWSLLLRSQGVILPFPDANRVVWIGQFYNGFLPGGIGGDAVRLARAMAVAPGRIREVSVATLADRVVGFGTLLALGPALLAASAQQFPELQIGGKTLGTWTLLLAFAGGFAGLVIAVLIRRPPFARWHGIVRQLVRDIRANGIAVVLSVAVWLADFASGWWLARSVGLDLEFATLSFALVVAYLSTILPISLGGHGVREGALIVVLVQLVPGTEVSTFGGLAMLFLAVNVACSALGGIVLIAERNKPPQPQHGA